MKILSIGNSFSQDAHKYLPRLAMENGVPMELYNLYIAGCSLEKHWENAVWNKRNYLLEKDGVSTDRYVSLREALELETWDVITFQQSSPYSGMPQTYVPYLTSLAKLVQSAHPAAELYFHQTWAYEWNADRPGFAHYQNDQREMYRRISDASVMASKLLDAPLIPVGSVIQCLREKVPAFDFHNGGLSLCRDGFHLSLDYGRFTAAAVWFRVLCGRLPKAQSMEHLDPALLAQILRCIEESLA
jgi:hypothetical protein